MKILMNIFFKNRTQVHQNQRLNRIIVTSAFVSLAAYFMVHFLASERKTLPYSDTMVEAAQIMQSAISIISEHCAEKDIYIDNITDPNHTGLIGPEYSEITTSLGHPGAKRTTTNPNFAALIVHLLYQADVSAGDTIALGCSASFPSLMIASLAAAKALEIYPVSIISSGASSFGATNTDFNLLDIYQLLLKEDVFTIPPAAISLGGDRDIGEGFAPDIKERLVQQILSSKIPFINESDLQENVSTRMKIYFGNSSESRISAFINSGGSYANLGISELVLNVNPGLNNKLSLPAKKERGVLFEMAAQNIPIIHLLYIKGLRVKYGLPWDPVPLPNPGDGELYELHSDDSFRFWLIAVIYFAVLIVLFTYCRK